MACPFQSADEQDAARPGPRLDVLAHIAEKKANMSSTPNIPTVASSTAGSPMPRPGPRHQGSAGPRPAGAGTTEPASRAAHDAGAPPARQPDRRTRSAGRPLLRRRGDLGRRCQPPRTPSAWSTSRRSRSTRASRSPRSSVGSAPPPWWLPCDRTATRCRRRDRGRADHRARALPVSVRGGPAQPRSPMCSPSRSARSRRSSTTGRRSPRGRRCPRGRSSRRRTRRSRRTASAIWPRARGPDRRGRRVALDRAVAAQGGRRPDPHRGRRGFGGTPSRLT